MIELPDRAAVLQSVGGDEETLRELAAVFLRTCHGMVEAIRAAVDRASAADLATAAHKLKGSAGFLGAGSVAELARQLEDAGRGGDLAGATAMLDRLDEAAEASLEVIAGWLD